MMSYMSIRVVMIDLGNLRDQIFPRTGFAPSGSAFKSGCRFHWATNKSKSLPSCFCTVSVHI